MYAMYFIVQQRHLQDIKEFKERMALVPLRYVDRDELVDLAKAEDVVYALSADVSCCGPGVLCYIFIVRSFRLASCRSSSSRCFPVQYVVYGTAVGILMKNLDSCTQTAVFLL